MAFTETRTTGYGSRLSNSCMGIPMGIILFLVATALLWWNEGRAVRRAQDIKLVAKTAQSIGDISNANASFDGQLIHTTGTAATEDILSLPKQAVLDALRHVLLLCLWFVVLLLMVPRVHEGRSWFLGRTVEVCRSHSLHHEHVRKYRRRLSYR